MKKKYLLTDVDGVLLHWLDGFVEYMRNNAAVKNGNVKLPDEYPTDWNLSPWLGTDPAHTDLLIDHFNHSIGFSKLRPIYGAVRCLQFFKEMNYGIVAITSCSTSARVKRLREKNLNEVFGKKTFEDIHYVDLGKPKGIPLRMYPVGSLWVEDNYYHALTGIGRHQVKLLTAPHNKNLLKLSSHVERMESWYYIWAQAALQH